MTERNQPRPPPRYPLSCSTWGEAEIAAIHRVIASGRYTMGSEVMAFEAEFAAHFGSRHAVMVNSGSSANLLAIAGLRYHPDQPLRPGSEILVPAVSWSTTFFPVHHLGFRLRFVDVDRDTLNLDLDGLEAAMSPETGAVLAVHLLGNPVDFDRLRGLCGRHDLVLIEDSCESMGAMQGDRHTGTVGRCGTFSTFYSHHISTMEGGVLVTDDEALFHTALALRAHGWVREQPASSHLQIAGDEFERSFRFVLPGFNLRPLEMSGAIGRAQLKKLPSFLQARRRNAEFYRQFCGDIDGIRLQRETGKSAWFGFSFLLEGPLSGKRASLVKRFAAEGIECRPIVAGNFLNNPVIAHLNHRVARPLEVSDATDRDGLFIGNHHLDLEADLRRVGSVLKDFALREKNSAAVTFDAS